LALHLTTFSAVAKRYTVRKLPTCCHSDDSALADEE